MADEPTQQDTSRDAAAVSLAERLVTAYHEAGHAVMALILGRQIHKITIAPGQLQTGGVRLGACQIQKRRGKGARDAMEDEILFLLAGMVAESQLTERYCAAGAAQDLAAVRRILRDCPGSERQLERLERRFLNKTEHLLSAQASVHAIELIAKQLLEHTTVSGRAAVHLFEIAQRKFGDD
ncbi:MAG: M50 family metallopeptidase [Planctomycetales bacterium]|nr:M50 family metallopeptidase [Planctomycetales bacterium]MCA9168114.1 M50 family metallopeptidase [Planctomycetales bacterium]